MTDKLSDRLRHLDAGQFWVIGNRISGHFPEIVAAFAQRDPEPLRQAALSQKENGADMIAVLPPPDNCDRESLLWAIPVVQEVAGSIPLAVPAPDAAILEEILRVCNVPPLVCALRVQPDEYENLLPVAARHQTDIAVQMAGPEGFPPDENGRIVLMMELLNAADEAGVCPENIWIDGGTGSLKTDPDRTAALIGFMDTLPGLAPQCMAVCSVTEISGNLPEACRSILDAAFAITLRLKGVRAFLASADDPVFMDLAHGRKPDVADIIQRAVSGSIPRTDELTPKLQLYVKAAMTIIGKIKISDGWPDET